jgi:hypothetical protein
MVVMLAHHDHVSPTRGVFSGIDTWPTLQQSSGIFQDNEPAWKRTPGATGRQPAHEGQLFYDDISLERRIAASHLLRRIKETIAFACEEVEDGYRVDGNVSAPGPR